MTFRQGIRIGLAKALPGINSSRFAETGQITKDEFTKSGDYLNSSFPTWKWDSPEKNYIFLENAVCAPVAEGGEIETIAEDDWTIAGPVGTMAESDQTTTEPTEATKPEKEEEEDDFDVDDLDIDDVETVKEGQPDAVHLNVVGDDEDDDVAPSSGTRNRSYTIYIVYDAYYSTPRVFLCGINSDGQPLGPEEWKEDFSSEHVGQTVTYEKFPYGDKFQCPSVHPCKHADAMKTIIQMTAGTGNSFDVKYYLLIFLKFIQSIVPNIEYDYTGEFQIEQETA